MTTTITSQQDGRSIRINGELTIYAVAQVKEVLWSALEKFPEIEVDLSAVDEFDTSGLQLLLMCKRWPDRSVVFINHSAAVINLIELSNVILGDPIVMSEAH